MSFGELPITMFDIFRFVEFIGHCSCMHYVNTSFLEKVVNIIQYTFQKNCLINVFFFQELAESSSYSLYISNFSKHGLGARGICVI